MESVVAPMVLVLGVASGVLLLVALPSLGAGARFLSAGGERALARARDRMTGRRRPDPVVPVADDAAGTARDRTVRPALVRASRSIARSTSRLTTSLAASLHGAFDRLEARDAEPIRHVAAPEAHTEPVRHLAGPPPPPARATEPADRSAGSRPEKAQQVEPVSLPEDRPTPTRPAASAPAVQARPMPAVAKQDRFDVERLTSAWPTVARPRPSPAISGPIALPPVTEAPEPAPAEEGQARPGSQVPARTTTPAP